MPTKKVKISYLCNICYEEYIESGNLVALECESRGVALPEFKTGQVVKLIGLPDEGADATVYSGHKVHVQNGHKAIVHWDDVNDRYNPHLLPQYYEAWLATPGNPSHYKRELARLSREHLAPTSVRNGLKCPLCSSDAHLSKNFMGRIYIGLGGTILPFAKKMKAYQCVNCNAVFLTDEQSLRINEFVEKNIKWSLRDTKKLIREHEFQY